MSRIPLEVIFRRSVDVVERGGVRYLVYGGLALPVWGSVTTTQDVDLVVHVTEEEAARLIHAFRMDGFRLPDDAERLFTIDTWTTASLGGRDVDIAWGATDFDLEALSRAVTVHLFDRVVPVASAEDLILYKLTAHRRKDLGHVEDIILRQGTKLDLKYLRSWAQRIASATGRFEVPATLEKLLAEEGL
ncbi:MAG: hypothetical protein HY721_35540 [Planctomycetes bacterium]|nr:hypothetical protein [Planctomycetota bacterium]